MPRKAPRQGMLTPKAHHKEETQSNTETTAEMTSMSKNFLDYSLQRAENYQQCTPAHPHLCGNTRRQQIFKAIPSLLGKAPTTLRGERLRAACSGAAVSAQQLQAHTALKRQTLASRTYLWSSQFCLLVQPKGTDASGFTYM